MNKYDRIKLPISAYQKLELALMPTRHESTITTRITIKSEHIHRFLDDNNTRIFPLVIYACLKTVVEYPVLRRFVLNSQLYKHKRISMSTVMKKDKHVEGDNTVAKIFFEENDSLSDIHNKLEAAIMKTRSGEGLEGDKLIEGFGKLPTWLFKLVVKLLRTLDHWDLLANSLIDDDPLHTTAVIANLGGIDGFSVDHHLYNWGTASFFLTFGRLKEDGSLDISFTVDERISEGLVLFRALTYFRSIMEKPYEHI